MIKNLFILVCLISTAVFSGCGDDSYTSAPPPGTKQTAYYITNYLDVNDIGCMNWGAWPSSPIDMNYGLFSIQPPMIKITFHGDKIIGEDNEQFVRLQKMYCDTQYTGSTGKNSNGALAYPIEKITMICDDDFDAEHPAGAAVDDIVKIHISTYETFIRNGYEYPANWQHRKYYGWGVMPVGEFYLSEVNEDNSKLIPALMGMTFMKFIQEPEVAGEYPFTLTITMNGEEISKIFKVTFGETTAEE